MSDRCGCCRRPWPEIPGNGGDHTRRRDVSACTECIPHLESTLQKNSDHLAAWRGVVERHDRAHATEVARLTARIQELTTELEARPEKIVARYVDRGELLHAQ